LKRAGSGVAYDQVLVGQPVRESRALALLVLKLKT
jgi:hypothetical protein